MSCVLRVGGGAAEDFVEEPEAPEQERLHEAHVQVEVGHGHTVHWPRQSRLRSDTEVRPVRGVTVAELFAALLTLLRVSGACKHDVVAGGAPDTRRRLIPVLLVIFLMLVWVAVEAAAEGVLAGP
eukprot:CAMPEP_0202835828 /NCGR_PEP_ID=MMETSP1389-20130828/38557_1 /ASSEMBLY_ACC=CAM_ASM_000865 /TAXON_ID=302021 /ORGANISM="Rhodomonas sp., Strain CCMP768" /LENGTH=124 /DNA_ID=CAMNT_0049511447 /DNA_START=38 /DNA_END=409 /DNA_ORIENTATION=-